MNPSPMSDKITWSEIKEVCTSLDNIFYGAMVYAAIGLLYWLWMVMSVWLIIAPVGYVVMCYLGQFIKKYGNRPAQTNTDNVP